MKEIHKKLYGYLDQINDFYKNKGIELIASAGTLLGAIREGEIIEWDDDIDLEIKESQEQDFLKFTKELEEKLGWICYYHAPNDGYKFKDKKGSMIPVDIFILRKTPKKLSLLRKVRTNLLLMKVLNKGNVNSFRSTKMKIVVKILKPIAHLLIWGKKDHKDVVDSMRESNSKYLAELSSAPMRVRTLTHEDRVEDIIEIKFGNTKINVYKNADERLTKSYGDWKTPKVWADHGNE